MTGYTLANGATKTITYDGQDRLSGLSYSAGGSALVGYTFTYDQASNIVTKNNDTYTYDAVNQLTGASENGWFQKRPEDLSPSYAIQDRDYTGTQQVSFSGQVTATTMVQLDTACRSVALDLGKSYGVNKIELHPKDAALGPRVGQHQDIHVFASTDNTSTSGTTGSYAEVTGFQVKTDSSNGIITLNFPTLFRARYIKVNTIWDDRDIHNVSLDEATVVNTASELVKIWALVPSQNQSYAYDAIGNRNSVTIDGKAQSYTYYQNQNGGSLSWVRYDGSWYYEYDQAGNRIAKAKALLTDTGSNQDLLDTTQEYWQYRWDLHNRLVNVTKNGKQLVAYTYDAANFRVQRVGEDGTTVYAYDLGGTLAYQKNLTTGLTRTIVRLGGNIVGWTDMTGSGSTKYYAATDQIGSVTQVYDSAGRIVWQSEYTAFGNVAGAQGSISFAGMFAGEDIDPDTGLTYHWNRWRSEDGASFISEDPAKDGINWYSYGQNSPVTDTDPTGLWGWNSFWKSVGKVAGGILDVGLAVGAFTINPFLSCAVIGAEIGGSLANSTINPFEWDYSNPSTYLGIGMGAALGYSACLAIEGAPLGQAIGTGFIIGAEIGGSEVNHNANPLKWEWHSTKTWGGMFIGGAIGAAGSYAGAQIAFALTNNASFCMGVTPLLKQALAYGIGFGTGNAITGGLDTWAFGDVDNGFFQGDIKDSVEAALWAFAYGFVGGCVVGALTPTEAATSTSQQSATSNSQVKLYRAGNPAVKEVKKDMNAALGRIVWDFVKKNFSTCMQLGGENLVAGMNVLYEATRTKIDGSFEFKPFGCLDIKGAGAVILGGLFKPILFSSNDRDSCPGWGGSLSDGSVTHQSS